MRTFASLAFSGSFTSYDPAHPLVGRMVANTEFAKALFHHGSFESYCFFIGENREREEVRRAFLDTGLIEESRLRLRNLLELPGCLERGDLSLLHHHSNLECFLDLVWLRDQYSRCSVPVTAQLHSLSYPRELGTYLRALLWPPSASDGVFCSSEPGRQVVEGCLAGLSDELREAGHGASRGEWELAVVPLGVDVDALQRGDGLAMRRELGIEPEAFVVLCIARFSEYDKMDLFPLLQAFQGLVRRARGSTRPPLLLLAGSRQETRTPEMLMLWARMLRIQDRVKLRVNFAEPEKRHLLAAADLFVSPCDNPQETFGLSVVEAMAAGLPVVVSDFDGYRDTVTDEVGIRISTRMGELSFLRDIGPLLHERPLHLFLAQNVEVDLAELEQALFELHVDHARRAGMAQAAGKRARSLYDWKVVIARYEEVWRRLSESRAVRRRARHPLGLDFQRVFAHYPSAELCQQDVVSASAAGRLMCGGSNHYPVYPELSNLFSDDEVVAVVRAAQDRPKPIDVMLGVIRGVAADRPEWHARYLLTWLLKHGLLVRR